MSSGAECLAYLRHPSITGGCEFRWRCCLPHGRDQSLQKTTSCRRWRLAAVTLSPSRHPLRAAGPVLIVGCAAFVLDARFRRLWLGRNPAACCSRSPPPAGDGDDVPIFPIRGVAAAEVLCWFARPRIRRLRRGIRMQARAACFCSHLRSHCCGSAGPPRINTDPAGRSDPFVPSVPGWVQARDQRYDMSFSTWRCLAFVYSSAVVRAWRCCSCFLIAWASPRRPYLTRCTDGNRPRSGPANAGHGMSGRSVRFLLGAGCMAWRRSGPLLKWRALSCADWRQNRRGIACLQAGTGDRLDTDMTPCWIPLGLSNRRAYRTCSLILSTSLRRRRFGSRTMALVAVAYFRSSSSAALIVSPPGTMVRPDRRLQRGPDFRWSASAILTCAALLVSLVVGAAPASRTRYRLRRCSPRRIVPSPLRRSK